MDAPPSGGPEANGKGRLSYGEEPSSKDTGGGHHDHLRCQPFLLRKTHQRGCPSQRSSCKRTPGRGTELGKKSPHTRRYYDESILFYL